MSKQTRFSTTTTTKRLLMLCIATLCVATAFLVRAEDTDIATQMAKLLADDGSNQDWFGISVAISNGIAVVGARQDDDKVLVPGPRTSSR